MYTILSVGNDDSVSTEFSKKGIRISTVPYIPHSHVDHDICITFLTIIRTLISYELLLTFVHIVHNKYDRTKLN